jgi:hypothetical protein
MINEWGWFQDFLIYLVYFNVDKPIPADIYKAHSIRERINGHLMKGSLLISLLEFIEKFGASTVRLYDEMEAINEMEARAEDLYRQDDYDSAAEAFEEIDNAWREVNARAIDAKEHALLWVYLVEWFSVAGVAMVAGSFLWIVMIRRGLYRETGVTKAGESA